MCTYVLSCTARLMYSGLNSLRLSNGTIFQLSLFKCHLDSGLPNIDEVSIDRTSYMDSFHRVLAAKISF